MAYTYDKTLETGHTLIDSQHKELIAAINSLMEACNQGKGREETKKTIAFLKNYTDKHFGDEEVLQQKYNYPDIVNHKKLHQTFKDDVKAISEDFDKNGTSVALTFKVNNIAAWFINHIKIQDKKVAAHINSQK